MARQQRPDLIAADCVIEHEQQFLASQTGSPQSSAVLKPGRDFTGGDPDS